MLITEVTSDLSKLINQNSATDTRERSHTLPSMISRSAFIRNSIIELKRAKPLTNLYHSSLEEKIISLSKLHPIEMPTGHLNAKDYIYLGCCETSFVADVGMTLDNSGQIILIKGKSRDLISGLYHKYIKKKSFRYFVIKKSNNDELIKFDALYVNERGELIGKVKHSAIFYTINIDKHVKKHFRDTVEGEIQITFQKYTNDDPANLNFINTRGTTLNFHFKEGKIQCSESVTAHGEDKHHPVPHDLQLPFSKKYIISSVKKTRNCLQIETIHKRKTRIYYLDPLHITKTDFVVQRVSHKPPQNIYSCLGGDIHEKYDSGQPFSSTRLGNFSSKRIPLFAALFDNARHHWKKAAQSAGRGDKYATLLNRAKAFDPGLRALNIAAHNIFSTNHRDEAKQDEIPYINTLKNDYKGLINELPDTVTKNKTVSGALSEILFKMEENDSISLSKHRIVSGFFGIARGGVPFASPAHFFGLVAALSNTHRLTIEKMDKEKIRFSFVKNRNKILTVLFGTGQGLERKLFNTTTFDFLTVMPLEANIILSAFTGTTYDFSFDIKIKDLSGLINNTHPPSKSNIDIQSIINTLIINKKNEFGTGLSLEFRAPEFRAQVGMVDGFNNYLLLPRNGICLMWNADIITLKKRIESKIRYNTQTIERKESDTTLKLLSPSLSVVGECKIMPIISSNINDKDYFFPIPIIENSKRFYSKQKDFFCPKTYVQTKTKSCSEIHPENKKSFLAAQTALNNIDDEMEYVASISKILKIKLVRSTPECAHKKNKHERYYIKDIECDSKVYDNLKRIRKDLVNKKRDNINKKMSFLFHAKYHLISFYQTELSELKEEIKKIPQTIDDIASQKIKIKYLQEKIHQFQENAKYRLRLIEIKSSGQLSKVKASLPNLVSNLIYKKTFTYNKHFGDIAFEYENNTTPFPYKITCNYNFL